VRDASGGGSGRLLALLGRLGDRLLVLATAGVLALGVRHFVVEPFRIPSESMLPTLLVGDHLFVDKLAYGARLPGSDQHLPALHEPQRGEVVVFEAARRGLEVLPADLYPELPRERFVKRIVGVPGDLVEVREGEVRVNGEPLAVPGLARSLRDGHGRELRCHEERSGPRRWQVADDPTHEDPEGVRLRVPEGRFFLLGDNRDHSSDSRIWGTVARAELTGPARWLYWSWDWRGSLAELLRPGTWWTLLRERTRWDRVGETIR
jgi:signal peptidase I